MRRPCNLVRLAIGTLCLALACQVGGVSAEEVAPPSPSKFQFEGKVSSWLSQGETRWSHNASGSNSLLGNPTSQLKFKDVGTNVVEFGGQVTYAQRFFARAEYGFADIGGGRLTDDDYVSAAGATFYGTSTFWARSGSPGPTATSTATTCGT